MIESIKVSGVKIDDEGDEVIAINDTLRLTYDEVRSLLDALVILGFYMPEPAPHTEEKE